LLTFLLKTVPPLHCEITSPWQTYRW